MNSPALLTRPRTPWSWSIATVFGVGLLPGAPGTWASLVGAALGFALRDVSANLYAWLCAGLCAVAIWATHDAERARGTHDDARIVVDELVGMLCALAFVDRGDLTLLISGFVLFRFFDMVKPWPIHWIDRHTPGAAGVVLDDVAAGLAAACVLSIAHALAG